MTWDDVWKIVVCGVSSVGGIGAVVAACTKFTSGLITARLEQKYSFKIEKEMEDYKKEINKEMEQYRTILANKNYVSKTRFDAEFTIYRELSLLFFEMVKTVTNLIPPGLSHRLPNEQQQTEYEEKLYQSSLDATIKAQNQLRANEPFIAEDFFNKYLSILGQCQKQLSVFERRWNLSIMASYEEKKKITSEEYSKSEEIRKDLSSLNIEIRDYLAQLEVIR